MVKGILMTKATGVFASITQHAWMFQTTYEKLRSELSQYSFSIVILLISANAT